MRENRTGLLGIFTQDHLACQWCRWCWFFPKTP